MVTDKKKCTLILLAGGRGKRMGSDIPKQFIELNGKPVLWYSLEAAEKSDIIDECVLVYSPEDETIIRSELLDKYNFTKIKGYAKAGRERYESVWSGLASLAGYDWMEMAESSRKEFLDNKTLGESLDTDIVFIHDGARPFVDEEILKSCYEGSVMHGACVAAVRSKDTIKIVGDDGLIINTPDRSTVWNMQTPQTFDAELIYNSYRQLMSCENITVTDDAQVVELMGGRAVYVVEGAYTNIKVTTPDDLILAEAIINKKL